MPDEPNISEENILELLGLDGIPVNMADLMALVNAGLIEVVTTDKHGKPERIRVTQAAKDYVEFLENEEG